MEGENHFSFRTPFSPLRIDPRRRRTRSQSPPFFFFTVHGDTSGKHWEWDAKDIFSRHPTRRNTGQFYGIARTWSADKELWRLLLESFFMYVKTWLSIPLHTVQILEVWILVRGVLPCLFNRLFSPLTRFSCRTGVNACEFIIITCPALSRIWNIFYE